MSKNYNTNLQTNNTNLQAILNTINTLPEAGSGGGSLPTLTNPAVNEEVFEGKEYIDNNGNKKTGNFTINEELNTIDTMLTQLESSLNGKIVGGGGNIETCSVRVMVSGMRGNTMKFTYIQQYINGQISTIRLTSTTLVENVPCNSIVVVSYPLDSEDSDDYEAHIGGDYGDSEILFNSVALGIAIFRISSFPTSDVISLQCIGID